MEVTQTIMQFTNLQLDSKVLLSKWWDKDAHINSTTTIEEIKAKIIIHKNEWITEMDLHTEEELQTCNKLTLIWEAEEPKLKEVDKTKHQWTTNKIHQTS
mgnify:CR=1 FL=1|jgi:hypothetical protein